MESLTDLRMETLTQFQTLLQMIRHGLTNLSLRQNSRQLHGSSLMIFPTVKVKGPRIWVRGGGAILFI